MSSPDERWWQVHAGEYVLGTLDAKERGLFERILKHDPDLQRMVSGWESRLAPLVARVPAREPPARVWEAIERRVRAGGDAPVGATAERGGGADGGGVSDGAGAGPAVSAPPTVSVDGPVGNVPPGGASDARASGRNEARGERAPAERDVPAFDRPPDDGAFAAPAVAVPLERTARRRGGRLAIAVAALATAASLVMGALLHQQGRRLDALEGSVLQAEGISVILGEDGAPLWLVQADFATERVRVTALAPPPAGGEGDYQLWQVLPDGGGVAAVSLLPEADGLSRVSVVPGLARRFDAFAVSLEPDGGSPEPVPTGAVLYQGGVTFADEE